jgi:UrcA family protein
MKISTATISTLLMAGAALSVKAVAAQPHAHNTNDSPSKSISIKDLDLAEPSHLPILYARVQQGATAVCDYTVRAERRLHRRVAAGWRDRCVRSAVDEAIRSVGDRRLSALHSGNPQLMADKK